MAGCVRFPGSTQAGLRSVRSSGRKNAISREGISIFRKTAERPNPRLLLLLLYVGESRNPDVRVSSGTSPQTTTAASTAPASASNERVQLVTSRDHAVAHTQENLGPGLLAKHKPDLTRQVRR